MSSTEKDLSCENLSRPQPNIVVNKEIAAKIGSGYRTLPVFEKGLFEYTCIKHYSLENNEFLKCQWTKYKRNIEERVFAPFQFLDIRDYHFYKCRTRLIPSESIHTKKDFSRKLKPGPGVDYFGQMPIPQELQMKRGTQKQKKSAKEIKDGGKVQQKKD